MEVLERVVPCPDDVPEQEQQILESFLDPNEEDNFSTTEEVVKAFRQIKGATVTVIKKSKRKKSSSSNNGNSSKKVKLIITSKKSVVSEDNNEKEDPKKKKKKPKKVNLVITRKKPRRPDLLSRDNEDDVNVPPVSPLQQQPPAWSVLDDALEQRIKEDQEEGDSPHDFYEGEEDDDDFDPNEVLRKAELDRASRKKQDSHLLLHGEPKVKEDPDGAPLPHPAGSPSPSHSPLADIKIEGEDIFEDPSLVEEDFYNEEEEEEEEFLPKKRPRRAPKRRRIENEEAQEDKDDLDFELRNELAELNGLEPEVKKKKRRGPGRPPKIKKDGEEDNESTAAPKMRRRRGRRPGSKLTVGEEEEYEGVIEMKAVTLDAYVVNKTGGKTFPRLNKIHATLEEDTKEDKVKIKTEDDDDDGKKEASSLIRDHPSSSPTKEPAEKSTESTDDPPKSRDRFMYGCSFCPYVGRKQKWLVHLKESHGNRNLLFCTHSRLCSMPFTCQVSLEKHVALMHKELFKCDLCKKEFKFRSQLKQHAVVHLAEEDKEKSVHICPYCGKNFQTRTGFRSHEAHYHTKILRHKCEWEDCDKAFFNKNELTIHMRLHTKELPFTCSYCGSGFVSRSRMIHHEKAMHLGVGKATVKCEICLKMIRKKDIVYHVKTHKGLNKDWCSFCGKEFNSKGAKKRHEKIHNSDKKYSCSYCGKCFVQKVNMESHERIHTGVKPYKCKFCGEGFVQGTRRNQHQASCRQRAEGDNKPQEEVPQSQSQSLQQQQEQHGTRIEFKT